MSENTEVLENGKWITRKDAACLAGCSIVTIRRAEKRHAFTERYDATTNEKLLAVEELVRYDVIDACQATVPESLMTRSRVERDNSDLRLQLAQLKAINGRLLASTLIALPDGDVMLFAELADLWLQEHYIEMQKAEAGRVADVRGDLRNHLVPAFNYIFALGPIEARKVVIDWTRAMAGKPPSQASSPFNPAPKPYARSTVTELLWVLREVINYGHMLGLTPAVPLFKVVAGPPLGRPDKRAAPLISITECVTLASKLHIVHQVTLWLLRLAGLRISEAVGLQVGSFIFDDDGDGFLIIEQQSGRLIEHYTDDDKRTSTGKRHRWEFVKTVAGYRLIAIPAALTRTLVDLISVCHTETNNAPGRAVWEIRDLPLALVGRPSGILVADRSTRRVGLCAPVTLMAWGCCRSSCSGLVDFSQEHALRG